MNVKKMTERAEKLLRELDHIKSQELSEWNIRAQTLLVFVAIARLCSEQNIRTE